MIAVWTTLATLALATFVVAHVRLVLTSFRRRGARALLALLVPPLAPLWAWDDDEMVTLAAWGGALVVYAVVVSLA